MGGQVFGRKEKPAQITINHPEIKNLIKKSGFTLKDVGPVIANKLRTEIGRWGEKGLEYTKKQVANYLLELLDRKERSINNQYRGISDSDYKLLEKRDNELARIRENRAAIKSAISIPSKRKARQPIPEESLARKILEDLEKPKTKKPKMAFTPMVIRRTKPAKEEISTIPKRYTPEKVEAKKPPPAKKPPKRKGRRIEKVYSFTLTQKRSWEEGGSEDLKLSPDKRKRIRVTIKSDKEIDRRKFYYIRNESFIDYLNSFGKDKVEFSPRVKLETLDISEYERGFLKLKSTKVKPRRKRKPRRKSM